MLPGLLLLPTLLCGGQLWFCEMPVQPPAPARLAGFLGWGFRIGLHGSCRGGGAGWLSWIAEGWDVADGTDIADLAVALLGHSEREDSGGRADLVLGAVVVVEVGGHVDEFKVDTAVGELVVSSAHHSRRAA